MNQFIATCIIFVLAMIVAGAIAFVYEIYIAEVQEDTDDEDCENKEKETPEEEQK